MEKSILNLDLYSFIPYAIVAFSHVYGIEYREHLKNNLEHTIINIYRDVDGLSSYIFHLKRCKNRELAIKFLSHLDFEIPDYPPQNFTLSFNDETEELLYKFIYYSYSAFENMNKEKIAICAFEEKNADSKKRTKQKIDIINYLRSPNNEPITEENLEEFIKSPEYQKIIEKVNELLKLYYELKQEYEEWEKVLEPYEKYVKYENERKSEILKFRKSELFRIIYPSLPLPVLKIIQDKPQSEQEETIFSYLDISCNSLIENFSQEKMDKLYSKDIEPNDKFWIVYWQSQYLKNLGITIPNTIHLDCKTTEDIANYLNFINQSNIKQYIPPNEVIRYITTIREKKYDAALNEYFKNRNDFKAIMQFFDNNENNINYFLSILKKVQICVAGEGGHDEKNNFLRIMSFTVRSGDHDKLAHNFLHEAGHAIDQNEQGTGFEPLEDYRENGHRNPYDSRWRKYERFNETINDIFTIEALEYLNSVGIYLIQPYEFTCLDTSNHNTFLVTKDLLRPLIKRFRAQVIKAKLNSEPNYLVQFIGKEHYEALVDIVNKVDYLCHNGLERKLKDEADDIMVLEYQAQLEKLTEVYINIDNYYESHFGTNEEKTHVSK